LLKGMPHRKRFRHLTKIVAGSNETPACVSSARATRSTTCCTYSVASSNKSSSNSTLAARTPRSASVRNASILRCTLIELLSGANDVPAEARRIIAFLFELVGTTRNDVASHTKPSDWCVNGIVVKAGVSVRNLRNNEEIEVAVRSVAAFGAAAE